MRRKKAPPHGLGARLAAARAAAAARRRRTEAKREQAPDEAPDSPCSSACDKQAAEEETPPCSPSPSDADDASASVASATKMAASTSISRVFDIDKDDPDSWCTVGLFTNTECHQTILTVEIGIKSFCDLPAVEQAAITSRLGTDDVQTVCSHHQRFYLYAERHKRGCLDRLLLHEGDQPLEEQVTVTNQLAESCRDIVELEEGERLCKVCVDAIKSQQQDSPNDLPPKRNSFAFILGTKKYQDRAKRIDDMVTRCSIGLMRRSLCHMTASAFEECVKEFASMSYGTAKALVSCIGRTFDNICTHHEQLYLDDCGTPCFDPENKHSSQPSSGPKWLVPRRFSLICRGRYPLRPGRTVCLKCLKNIRVKYPEIDAFYKEDEKEIRLKLEQLAGSKLDDIKSEDENMESDGENSQKEDSNTGDEWKYDRLGRRRRNRNITTTERQLRNLRVENPEFSDVLNSLDIESHRREKRRVTKKVKSFDAASYRARPQRHYTARGIHIASNKDACDCLQPSCPGCHFPCSKCGSQKCGDECRCNRNYVYEQIEVEGYTNVVFVNSLLA
ncbi:uncharacterized protein LOC119386266 isoform X2 [Rhipicephalus sanguineus]|uniref:uncharacterized protein LOC119386266 isoform X2 n=1 Tax=Rhipicephalus sanguineus TaxID=34632 RepID=UPI0020C1F785|nr:uncharacterized protein LOC119386266 isoform X2 [Rhipicephalus sanguineus]